MAGAARQLFDSIQDESTLLATCAGTAPNERLHLEFKQRANPGRPFRKDAESLTHTAKTLSAFANADGGVFVLGVADDGTAAPLDNLEESLATAREQLSRLVAPRLVKADVKGVASAPDEDRGYLVFFVAASDEGPHMSLKEHRYYRRSSESSHKMEHFEIADMFGRRPQPHLRLRVTAKRLEHRPNPEVNFVFQVVNEGRGLARFPMADVRLVDGSKLEELGKSLWTHVRMGSKHLQVRGGADLVVYPGSSEPAFQVRRSVNTNPQAGAAIFIRARLHADGMSPADRAFIIPWEAFGRDWGEPTSSILQFDDHEDPED